MGVVKRQTAVASQELDRRYIGIELDPLCVRQAQKCLRLTGNRLHFEDEIKLRSEDFPIEL
jgi:DNA modification methylase